jgi:hypothetical protein
MTSPRSSREDNARVASEKGLFPLNPTSQKKGSYSLLVVRGASGDYDG